MKELNSFKERNGGHITIDYFTDEGNSYITEETLRSYLTPPMTCLVNEQGLVDNEDI